MRDDQSSDYEPSAFLFVTQDFIIFSSILPVLFFYLWKKTPIRSRDGKRTQYLMIGVLLLNLFYQIIAMGYRMVCIECNLFAVAQGNTRCLVKAINLIFLLHRAKLVQGMAPVLSKKWFEKILPTIILVLTFGLMLAVTRNALKKEFNCTSYSDSDVFQRCHMADVGEKSNKGVVLAWFAILLDSIITLGLMVLFIVPLYRVYNVDLGIMNDNQLRQRMKLRNLLIWSVALTFINQITSTLILIPAVITDSYPKLVVSLHSIGKCDPSINVWSLWLMVTRNRQFLQRVCCWQCISDDSVLMRRMSTALTDIPSRTNSLRRLWTKSPVELSAVEIISSQKPHLEHQSAELQAA